MFQKFPEANLKLEKQDAKKVFFCNQNTSVLQTKTKNDNSQTNIEMRFYNVHLFGSNNKFNLSDVKMTWNRTKPNGTSRILQTNESSVMAANTQCKDGVRTTTCSRSAVAAVAAGQIRAQTQKVPAQIERAATPRLNAPAANVHQKKAAAPRRNTRSKPLRSQTPA